MPNKVNKGEWAELFVFLTALAEGRIYAADSNLNRVPDLFYVILSAIKDEDDSIHKEYARDEHCRQIVLFENGKEITRVSIDRFSAYAETVLNSIKAGKGTFEIPEVEPFLSEINLTKIKAKSDSKKDIIFKIHDDFTGAEPQIGFSVKSYIGSKPTLLNASGATRIIFNIEGKLTEGFIDDVNSVNTREKIKDRISVLEKHGIELSFNRVLNPTFNRNLQMIDYRMPEILSNLFKYSYFVKGKSIPSVVKFYCDADGEDEGLISHKVKDLLVASALGMEPNTQWDGLEDANGGYIVVKDDGEVLCYHIYDRNKLREYLYNNTKFDSPSSSRTGAGKITTEGDHYIFGLTVQIRF